MARSFQSLSRGDKAVAVVLGLGVLACFGPGCSPAPPPPGPPEDPVVTEPDAGPTCVGYLTSGVATARGTLQTGVSPLDYEGRTAYVRLEHKTDVDPVEDGCVGKVMLEVLGPCRLTVDFGAFTGAKELKVTAATLTADSDCPGWLDHQEATYTLAVTQANTGQLAALGQVPDNQHWACVEVALSPEGLIRLAAPDRPLLTLDLGELTVTGWAYSKGRATLTCPAN
jgi:hypothetical protein